MMIPSTVRATFRIFGIMALFALAILAGCKHPTPPAAGLKATATGSAIVESSGGRVALAPLIDGRSTSAVIQKILDAYR